MAKVGDKFIIEIGEVFTSKGKYMACGENLYRVKGFESFALSDNDLALLKKFNPSHVAGPADGHDLPEFIYGMSSKDKQIYIGRVVWQRP